MRHQVGAGVNDLFAFVLAKSLACPLATGDARLRQAAAAEGLELLGTLTLLEQILSDDELANLKSQVVTSSWGGQRRATPYRRQSGRNATLDELKRWVANLDADTKRQFDQGYETILGLMGTSVRQQ